MSNAIEQIIRRIIHEELRDLISGLQSPVAVARVAPKEHAWLTSGEAAGRAKRHRVTVTRALQLGELRGVQTGHGGRWPACVDAWLMGGGCEHA